jgi:peroxiredoxin
MEADVVGKERMHVVSLLDHRVVRVMVKILDHLARLGSHAERFVELRRKRDMTTLVLGAPAPSFSLEDLGGRTVTIGVPTGRRALVAFLRNARCAVCNLWVHTTAARAAKWAEDGLDVVVVFESSASRLRAQFEGRVPPFAVLADPDGAAHDAWGSRSDAAHVREIVRTGAGDAALARAGAAGFLPIHEEDANFFRLPAEVLVERDGRVALLHVAEDVVSHLDPDLVAGFAREGTAALSVRRER